ncbi:uncharacterized protein LOC132039168 [Lycium ferocissimum]|uniref:uncharacterized protein LOC132039168 n=1 Tax=Lycium ferocissimum TaxID=112874 RepID=UPI002815620D|nr:uncharacterized protein LOC132039168 [Lycium ferocissimum]
MQQLALEELNYYPSSDDETYMHSYMFLGSCDGLILINLNQHIYLWNPATRFSTKVLELDRLNDDYRICGGLCFDSSKNVYKGRLHCSVRVNKSYFGNNDGEDDDNDRDNGLQESMWDRFGPRNQIIYFDPISEKFNMFSAPEPKSNKEENVIIGLGVINECLCMTRLDDDKDSVEILVMKEYGVKESWTSLMFIRNLEINSSYEFAEPFSMTETREVALIIGAFDKKITLYNPKDDNMSDVPVGIFCDIITYVESLISPEEYYWSEEQHKMIEHNGTKIAWIPR